MSGLVTEYAAGAYYVLGRMVEPTRAYWECCVCMNLSCLLVEKKQPRLVCGLEARHAPYSPQGDFVISSGLHSCFGTLLGMAYGGCGAEIDKMTLFR